jgi:methyltransferase (TIGR00027 family)
MDTPKHAVAATGLLVAAMRAEESLRDDALFDDPYAARLAGDDGRRLLAESTAATGQPSAPIVVRTRLYDEALLKAHADGLSQVVILAAGMDARSYRLPWRDGTTVFEVDQPQVIAIKDERLAGEQPRCRRVAVGVDLAGDWPKSLLRRGLTPPHPRFGWSKDCCSTSMRPTSTGCSLGPMSYRRPARCCCTTSSVRP